jgi:(p)ppGpp synthase/HD superfamily hydrolase
MENMNLKNEQFTQTSPALTAAISSAFVTKAKNYALKCHTETNHKYDGKPYETHLQMVVDYACRYASLIDDDALEVVIAAAWTHDTIEDCRQTYNHVKAELGIQVAEITYALTNEKGRTRKERANSIYYDGIRKTPFAAYVKLCDRLANVKYSKDNGSSMIEAYQKEHNHFKAELSDAGFQPMWDELSELLATRV